MGDSLQDQCPDMYKGVCAPPVYVRNNGIIASISDRMMLEVPTYITPSEAEERIPERVTIEQKIVPSTGTKLLCTTCGRQEWHTLILRRRAGLIEGLCKQVDGSGCYPLASRKNCSYTYPDNIDCPQVAEYAVALGKERLNPRQVCRDHVGEMLRQGPLYQVWPIEE